jgi:HEAT repeat protein
MGTQGEASSDPAASPPIGVQSEEPSDRALGTATLALTYIPDFPFEEVQFWFVPSRGQPREAYHELTGRSADKWGDYYYTKKGWRFVHGDRPDQFEGPFRAEPGKLHLKILDAGRFFAPRPHLEIGGQEVPLVSLEKRRPLNPWKPNYIKALNFIKKYEWEKPAPAAVQMAVWEIEECGEIAGSTAWQNAERLLADNLSPDVRAALADIFEKRPEEFPLGSEVYLRVLARSGPEGFRQVLDLHSIPFVRKRKQVALCLGKLGRPEAIDTLLVLLEDEDPEVRVTALRALGRIGIPSSHGRAETVRSFLESAEEAHRVWAAQALLKGGDESQRKFLINLVKEVENRPLSDMGELGEVLAELGLVEAVPFLINRLKSDNTEIQADAAEALRAVTGLPVEFTLADEDGKRKAIRAFNHWWEDHKKERRKERLESGD